MQNMLQWLLQKTGKENDIYLQHKTKVHIELINKYIVYTKTIMSFFLVEIVIIPIWYK